MEEISPFVMPISGESVVGSPIKAIFEVYRVALKHPSGSSLVVNNRTADVLVTSNRTVTLVLVPVELSTIISGRHAAIYVVNAYISQILVY